MKPRLESKSNSAKYPSANLLRGRFGRRRLPEVEAFTASLPFDSRLYHHDIMGSIAHARMLAKVRLISYADARRIGEGGDAGDCAQGLALDSVGRHRRGGEVGQLLICDVDCLAGRGEEKSDLWDENHPSFESQDRHNKNDDQRRHNLQEFHCLTVSPRGNSACSKLHNSVSLRVPLPGLPIGWRRLNQSAS